MKKAVKNNTKFKENQKKEEEKAWKTHYINEDMLSKRLKKLRKSQENLLKTM